MRTAEQFKEAILDVLEEERWTVPTLLETYNANHMTREGARVYALEHCVFAANFPRWLTHIAGNCPILEVRQYLIENAFVEEVRDPTIVTRRSNPAMPPTSPSQSTVDNSHGPFADWFRAHRRPNAIAFPAPRMTYNLGATR